MLVDLLPAWMRKVLYVLLAVASAVQSVFGVVDDALWGRLIAVAALLGFTLAAGNTAKE